MDVYFIKLTLICDSIWILIPGIGLGHECDC